MEVRYTLNDQGVKISFGMDEGGNIVQASLPLEGPAKPIVFIRQMKSKAMSKDSLQRYVGDYTISGANIKVYIKGENTLYVFVPGQQEYELSASQCDKDKFNFKALAGYSIQFSGNSKNEITELTFIQPNGNFKATRVVKL